MSQLLYIMWGKVLNPVFVCFCTLISNHPSTIYQKVYTLPIDLPWFVCWKFINNNERVYFWLLSLFHWFMYPILHPRLHCLDYCTSLVSLKSVSWSSLNFYFTSILSHLILWNEYACPHLHMNMQSQGKDINKLSHTSSNWQTWISTEVYMSPAPWHFQCLLHFYQSPLHIFHTCREVSGQDWESQHCLGQTLQDNTLWSWKPVWFMR